jgi:hypothetical protein
LGARSLRIKNNEEADKLARMSSDSHFCGPEACVPLSASIVRDMNRNWIDAQMHTLNTGSHLTAVENPSFGLNTPSCKQPNSSQDGTDNKPCLCMLPIERGDGTSLCVCLSNFCCIENTHNECVGIYRSLGIRNSAVCFPKRKIRA